jgi:hypothetical protein
VHDSTNVVSVTYSVAELYRISTVSILLLFPLSLCSTTSWRIPKPSVDL